MIERKIQILQEKQTQSVSLALDLMDKIKGLQKTIESKKMDNKKYKAQIMGVLEKIELESKNIYQQAKNQPNQDQPTQHSWSPESCKE